MDSTTTIYTIGYAKQSPSSLIAKLLSRNIGTVVDIRLRPDHAKYTHWVKTKSPTKGIEHTFSQAGIDYLSCIELGNVFMEFDNWQDMYKQLLESSGVLFTRRLPSIESKFCLLCAESAAVDCHRLILAQYLAKQHHCVIEHL